MEVIVVTYGKYGSTLVKQEIPDFNTDSDPDFSFEVTYTNTKYLREYTERSLSPSLAWRALRYGWSILDELHQRDSSIQSGQVHINIEDKVVSFGEGSHKVHGTITGRTHIDRVVPIAILRWNGGEFFGQCCLTGRNHIDPYTIEFKESMLIEPKIKVTKWFGSMY